jgi:hypothetical protein
VDRESVLEEQIAHVRDEITRLEDELAGGPFTVPGSKGQPVPNRLLSELRAHRWLLRAMLDTGRSTAGEVPPPAEDVVDRIRAEWENAGD